MLRLNSSGANIGIVRIAIQIQPMLRLNDRFIKALIKSLGDSNTTNVKVKHFSFPKIIYAQTNSNTTNVKVKPNFNVTSKTKAALFKYNQC